MIFLLLFALAAFFLPGVLLKYFFVRGITRSAWGGALRIDLVMNLFTAVYLSLLSVPILGYGMFSAPLPAPAAPAFLGMAFLGAGLDRAALRIFFRGAVKGKNAYGKLLIANLLSNAAALLVIRPCFFRG
jgi:hypothetical protein